MTLKGQRIFEALFQRNPNATIGEKGLKNKKHAQSIINLKEEQM